MVASRSRLSVTVDADVVRAGRDAVASGEALSLSAWVRAALNEKVQRRGQLRQLADAVLDYEHEFGHITEAESVAQRQLDSERRSRGL